MDSKFGMSVKYVGAGSIAHAMEANDLHEIKSFAGKTFHGDDVESVCVYENTGKARLYLKKTENGVYREEA